MNLVQKVRQIVTDIRKPVGPLELVDAWALAERLMGRMPGVDGAELKRVCAARDIVGLDVMVSRLERPAEAPKSEPAALTPEFEAQMESAMRAFRKRLKMTRLSDESKLRGRLTTTGRPSEIDAIRPPSEFPDEVWRALARAGRLKDMKDGFYGLAEEQPRV